MIWDSNDAVAEAKDKYRVTVLHVACDLQQAQDKKLPTSSSLVHYLDMKKGEEHYDDHYDIVMGNKVDIFDCYYDKLGSKRLKAIGFTGGTISPGNFDTRAYLKGSQ
jgi:hypothetical protein|tara:strand:+ start:257 stop:577 length:321 start_codon:yes stop_codon:yes gene_type:complete